MVFELSSIGLRLDASPGTVEVLAALFAVLSFVRFGRFLVTTRRTAAPKAKAKAAPKAKAAKASSLAVPELAALYTFAGEQLTPEVVNAWKAHRSAARS